MKPSRIAPATPLSATHTIDAEYTGEDVDLTDLGGVLDDLADVNAPLPADGDVLTWDDYLGEWIAAPGGGATLSDATPVQDGGAGDPGIGTDVSRDDHQHPGDTVAIVAVIDGGGSAITTGVKLDLRIPFACTLTSWTLLADQSGAIVIDVWRDTLANFPPADADALPGAGKEPTIAASGTNAEDTTITDWASDDITAGDCLRFNVDSCTAITRATLTLYALRT